MKTRTNSVIGKPGTYTPSTLARMLKDLLVSGEVLSIVRGLLQVDLSKLAQIEAQRHPNGFMKIRLSDNPGKLSLSLHIWPEDSVSGDIHSHRWNFASYVLEGSLINESYSRISGSTLTAYKCMPDVALRRYTFHPMERTGAQVQGQDTHTQGHIYEQELGILHSARAESAHPATTLMLQGPDEAPHSIVLLADEVTQGPIQVKAICAAEAREALIRLESQLRYA